MLPGPRSPLLLLLSAVCIAGCRGRAATPPPPHVAEVGVVTVRPRPVTLLSELPGRTTAFLTADVRPQVGGLVLRRTFTEGSDVAAGQTLYEIDRATYRAAYDSAVATLAHDEAAYATARAKEGRYRRLVAAEAVSRQDCDDAQAAAAEAKADVAAARAAVEQARISLAYTQVTAPIAGRIGRSAVTPGALVTASQSTSLATVTQLDPIYVDATEPATTVLRLRREAASGTLRTTAPNQARVRLVLEDGETYGRPGTLQFSEVTVDQGTGTVVLRAIFPNPDHLLLPGLFVREELQEGTDDRGLLVPQRGVSRNTYGDATVMVVGPGDRVASRVVETSRTIGASWLVTGGLSPGDEVVVDGLQDLRPGTVVHVREVDPGDVAAATD